MAKVGVGSWAAANVPQRILLVGKAVGEAVGEAAGPSTRDDGRALAAALVEDGYEVTHTENDVQLLECLHDIAECKLRAPSAIVLAARLSEAAGEALFRAIEGTGWHLPVVFAGGPGRYRGYVPPTQALFGPVDTADMRAVIRAVCRSPQLTLH
jgi:DNA-binding NtrC family response regulator